jgi:hypothetical protein
MDEPKEAERILGGANLEAERIRVVMRELYDALERANTNIALLHSAQHEVHTCQSGVDWCTCPLATNWRGNRDAMKHAREVGV